MWRKSAAGAELLISAVATRLQNYNSSFAKVERDEVSLSSRGGKYRSRENLSFIFAPSCRSVQLLIRDFSREDRGLSVF